MAYYKSGRKMLCASCGAGQGKRHGPKCAYSQLDMAVHRARGAGLFIAGLICMMAGGMYANWAFGHRLEKLEAKCQIYPAQPNKKDGE